MRTPAHQSILIVLAIALFLPGQAAATWTQLRTENFLFVGDASERQIRQVAQRLEQFREVMSRILPPAAVASPVPTVVFVFQTDRSLAPYKPRFEGRPVDVAGYFLARSDANYVAMNVEFEQPALSIVFHEYAHFLVKNTAGDVPLWADEGLAGIYETFEERNGGTSAVIGLPHRDNLARLQGSTLIPLRELMAVDHRSPVYNEGPQRRVFYAESWALVHYLMLGNEVRAAQLRDYLARTRGGHGQEKAFRDAFGDDVDSLERELREYVRNFSFPSLRLDFKDKVTGAGAGRGEAMNDADASAYLADLLSRLGRVDEGRALLKALVEANPTSARAVSTLGLLELKESRVKDALPLLERAAALDPADGAVLRALGRALYARSQEQEIGDAAAATTMQQARTVLTRAVELSPRDAETLSMLGRLESHATEHARATSLFERAVSIAPSEERHRLLLADSLMREKAYTRAATYLGPLADGSTDATIRESARDLLAFVESQNMRTGGATSPAGERVDPAPSAAPSARRPTATGGRFVPEFRSLGSSEQRVLGMFTAVTCRPGSIVIVIEADGKALRIAAEDLTKVEFITYRDTTPGTVGCGPVRPAPRVFATFREADIHASAGATDGHAIAIELLPDDFTQHDVGR